ncbi:DUF748 domain-containing protein [Pseudomonadota bacterium]
MEEAETKDAAADEVVASEDEENPWLVSLKKLHVDKSAHIKFEDRSIKPTYKAELTPFELTITDIDTGKVDQDINVACHHQHA